jgi:hypothetical protein
VAEPLAVLKGPVRCERGAPPLPLTLRGSAHPGGEPCALAFAGPAPPALPEVLDGAEVRCAGAGLYRITSGADSYEVQAPAVHYSRDVGAPFYRALPPRPVPLGKRLFWRTVLTLARSRAGLALLAALRR